MHNEGTVAAAAVEDRAHSSQTASVSTRPAESSNGELASEASCLLLLTNGCSVTCRLRLAVAPSYLCELLHQQISADKENKFTTCTRKALLARDAR